MFGKSWEVGPATVVAAEYFQSTAPETSGLASETKLIVEVHPPLGEPFRAKTTIHHLGLGSNDRKMIPPSEGDVLQVEFDAKSHKVRKVVLDDAHNEKLRAKTDKSRLSDALNAPVGSAVAPAWQQAPQITTTVINQPEGTTINGAPPGVDIAAILRPAGIDPANAGTVTVENVSAPAASVQPPMVSAADIIARGTAGTAIVQSVELVDQTVAPEGRTMVGITLQATIAGGTPYVLSNIYATPTAKLPSLTPGASVPVKADPGNSQAVAIDWDALG